MPMSKSPFETSILITGGAGFLGRGILRYIERNRIAAKVTVYSRDEQKHYALRSRFPSVRTVLGDVRDLDRLTAVMAGHEVVIHAAALKHIPEAERDVTEAVAVNVDGSRTVAWAAMRAGVKSVVGIGTDKEVDPANTYGATKFLQSRIFQEAQRLSPQVRFVNVRYGNVISSTGSVVPLFTDQIKRDHEVTVTSPAMTRFWLSIDDAVALIEKALGDDGRNGSTYVRLCPAMRIVDVAQAVWELLGLSGVVPFRIIGIRPGEKLHETLLGHLEAPYSMADLDDRYVIVPPALSQRGEGENSIMPYDSSHPREWITPERMAELIEDAKTI